jgi:hypothetical protein
LLRKATTYTWRWLVVCKRALLGRSLSEMCMFLALPKILDSAENIFHDPNTLAYCPEATRKVSIFNFKKPTLVQWCLQQILSDFSKKWDRPRFENSLSLEKKCFVLFRYKLECLCWAQCYKTFFVRNLQIFVISLGVFPGKLFHPSVMIAGMARANLSEALFGCSILG